VKSGVELECRVPNWIVNFFKQKDWAEFLDVVGDRHARLVGERVLVLGE